MGEGVYHKRLGGGWVGVWVAGAFYQKDMECAHCEKERDFACCRSKGVCMLLKQRKKGSVQKQESMHVAEGLGKHTVSVHVAEEERECACMLQILHVPDVVFLQCCCARLRVRKGTDWRITAGWDSQVQIYSHTQHMTPKP